MKKDAKAKVLAKFLEVPEEEIRGTSYSDDTFEHGTRGYLVLTDAEADSRAANEILESLWAFNPEFVRAHSKALSTPRAVKALAKMQLELCEDANPIVRALVDNVDDFIDAAIKADGRGHFLAAYDHEEHEVKVGGKWVYIYRVN